MLTVEIKLNGETIAGATVQNVSALAEVSDYRIVWMECQEPEMGIQLDGGTFMIEGHRRRQTVWSLVGKVVTGILGQMISPPEGKR